MRKVQAWEQLSDHEYSGGLNHGQFYDLLIQAGYSKEVARQAANKRGWDRLSANVTL